MNSSKHVQVLNSKDYASGRWSELEELMLVEGFKKFGPQFREISEFMGTRTSVQVLHHYKQLKHYSATPNYFNNKSLVSGRWTLDERKKLKEAIELFGKNSILKIAQFVGTRSEGQVRSFFHNYKIECENLNELLSI